jgi:hypothetical protein
VTPDEAAVLGAAICERLDRIADALDRMAPPKPRHGHNWTDSMLTPGVECSRCGARASDAYQRDPAIVVLDLDDGPFPFYADVSECGRLAHVSLMATRAQNNAVERWRDAARIKLGLEPIHPPQWYANTGTADPRLDSAPRAEPVPSRAEP